MTHDWIVIGAGITGAALSYELAKQGFSVLLVDRDAASSASRYSYGGIAYWSGTTALMRQICAEGIAIHSTLSEELQAETQFRELDLLLTIASDADPERVARSYAQVAIPPQLLTVDQACEQEPLLNRAAIAGALTVRHGHINVQAATAAYTQAFRRLGGQVQLGEAAQIQQQPIGIRCGSDRFQAGTIAVCAGGWSRSLLTAAGISVPLYFTQAELIETPPVDVTLRSLVMPAIMQRFRLEAESSRMATTAWDRPSQDSGRPGLAPDSDAGAVLDAGAVQFLDGSLKIGQISRIVTSEAGAIESATSEASLRRAIGEALPALQALPGTWKRCRVAFSGDTLPLIGAVPGSEGLQLFSGFSNPLAIVPPLARRFAQHAAGQPDSLLMSFSPERFLG